MVKGLPTSDHGTAYCAIFAQTKKAGTLEWRLISASVINDEILRGTGKIRRGHFRLSAEHFDAAPPGVKGREAYLKSTERVSVHRRGRATARFTAVQRSVRPADALSGNQFAWGCFSATRLCSWAWFGMLLTFEIRRAERM